MSSEQLSRAWRVPGLTAPQRIVLVALADIANADGEAYPGTMRLEVWTCLSERTVVRARQALREMGLLSWEDRGSHYGTHLYRLTIPQPVDNPPKRGGTSAQGGVTLTPLRTSPDDTLTPPGCHPDTPGVSQRHPRDQRTTRELPPYPPEEPAPQDHPGEEPGGEEPEIQSQSGQEQGPDLLDKLLAHPALGADGRCRKQLLQDQEVLAALRTELTRPGVTPAVLATALGRSVRDPLSDARNPGRAVRYRLGLEDVRERLDEAEAAERRRLAARETRPSEPESRPPAPVSPQTRAELHRAAQGSGRPSVTGQRPRRPAAPLPEETRQQIQAEEAAARAAMAAAARKLSLPQEAVQS